MPAVAIVSVIRFLTCRVQLAARARYRTSEQQVPVGIGHDLATVWECAWRRERERATGATSACVAARGGNMAEILNDVLLFACLAALVTGVVVAAATLLT
jgi:hypothetical protein